MTAEQIISAIRTETREGAITPQRLAEALAAVYNEAGGGSSGSGQIPADLEQRLKAIGTLASEAKTEASDAKTAANDAKSSADNAKSSADGAKTAAQNAEKKAQEALANASTPIWTGTQAQYDAITSKSATTLYFITD